MADTENTQTSAQPIVQWTDDEGRKHFTAEGSYAHQARIAEEALTEEQAPSEDKSDNDVAPPADVKTEGDAATPPAELTSTPGGRPAGPPKTATPKSS